MKPEEINNLVLPVANEGKILVGTKYYPLNGYYRNLLFAYLCLSGTYIMVDIVLN
jgi:hypothetical protein